MTPMDAIPTPDFAVPYAAPKPKSCRPSNLRSYQRDVNTGPPRDSDLSVSEIDGRIGALHANKIWQEAAVRLSLQSGTMIVT